MTLACDLRFMAEGDLLIGLPEMTLGIIPGAGGAQRLARVLGPGQALELILEGTVYAPRTDGARPSARGIEREDLLAEALATAERLARRSPMSVAAAKRAVYEGASRSLPEGLHIERAGFLASASTAGAPAAMEAYVRQVERLPAASQPLGRPGLHAPLAGRRRGGSHRLRPSRSDSRHFAQRPRRASPRRALVVVAVVETALRGGVDSPPGDSS